MRIKSVIIEFELTTDKERHDKLGTRAEFSDGLWTANGPIYSRFHATMHQVWQVLRGMTETKP